MTVAERYQVPRSLLLGRAMPRPGERLWLPDDLEWALEHERFKASVCGGCGTRREEWQADPDAYVAVTDRCPGCHELALSDEDIPEQERGRAARSVLQRAAAYDLRMEINEARQRLGLRPSPGGVG